MRKLTKKLFISVMTLVLTAMALGTSTFAWFSMNTSVTTTGMKVTTKVNNNLLIAATTTDASSALTEADFKTNYVADINAILEPTSTINGEDFYYTESSNVQGSGAATTATYIAYDRSTTAGKNAFDTNYGFDGDDGDEDCVGYVDYAFQLKATNTSSSAAAYVNLTDIHLVYGGDSTTEQAFRVAVLVEDMGTTLAAPTNTFTLKSILKTSTAAYFTSGQAVKDEDEKASVSSLGSAALIGTVAASTTNYYKVIIRLWLEGEDTTCNISTFANLTESWALDLTIKLQAATGGVTALTASGTATKINLASDTVSANTLVVDGVTYYQLSTNTSYYINTSSLTAASRVFTKTQDGGLIEVTNQCTLPSGN